MLKVGGAVVVWVAPHAQVGLELLNTPQRAERQLVSIYGRRNVLKRFGDNQYNDNRGGNTGHFIIKAQLLTR